MKNFAIAVVLVLGTFAISANLENRTKIGYVDKAYILNQMPEYQKAKYLLDNFESDNTRELNKVEREVNKLLGQIEIIRKEKGESTVEEKKSLQRIDALEKGNAVLKEKIQDEKNKLWLKSTKAATSTLEETLYKLSGLRGYTHVFDKPSERFSGDLLVAPQEDDLTVLIMDAMGLDYREYEVKKKRPTDKSKAERKK